MVISMIILICFLSGLQIVTSQDPIEVSYEITEENGANVNVGNIGDDAKLASLVSKPEDYQELSYSLLTNGNAHASKFHIDEATGSLTTAESLDRDSICAYEDDECYMEFYAISQSSKTGDWFKIKVQILLKDINDNTPTFPNDIVGLSISEAAEINSSFSLDGARDDDSGKYSVQSYTVASKLSPFEASSDTFTNGRSMLKLIVKRPLDREKTSSYMIQVLAYDGGNPANIGSLMVNISITDVNEYPPTFTKQNYNVTIFEDHQVQNIIVKVSANDPDGELNGQVKYSFSPHQSGAVFEKFSINENSGEIKLKRSLITDSQDTYRIIVEASDRADQPMLSQAQVFLKVLDNHNNEPKINIDLLSNTLFAEVSEHASQGAAVAHVAVTDSDTGENGLVTCDVLNKNFKIQKYDDMEYKIVVYSSLNRELHENYNVTVRCQDAGAPPKIVFSSFTVLILDENDNTPRFTQHNYYTHIRENNVMGLSALTVTATDIDKGQNAAIKYSLSSSNNHNFHVHPSTGQIDINFVLDRETQGQYSFEVLAVDHGQPAMTGTTTANIIVKDENDNAPIFANKNYQFYIQENLSPDVSIGQIFARDIDDGDNGKIEYSFTSLTKINNPPFWLAPNGTMYTTRTLDREKLDRYDVLMTARDNGDPPLQGSATITVHVIDDNDNAPVIIFPTKGNNSVSISYETPTNKVITTIHAYDNDSGLNSKLTFFTEDKNISDYFLVNSLTGEISLIKLLQSSDIGKYTFEVKVQDRGAFHLFSSETMVIRITDQLPGQDLAPYAVIAICISVITIFLAVVIIFVIYLLRRYDQRKQNFEKQEDSFSEKTTQEDIEAGFGDSSDSNSNVYQPPPSYHMVVPPPPPPRKPPPIDRSISLQVSVIPESKEMFCPSENPIWENSQEELDEGERHRNQLLYIQYQRSLMRIKSCKRSNSVLTI